MIRKTLRIPLVTYKSILVQVNDGAACRPRLRAAAELGARFDARIIGLYVRRNIFA